MPTILFTEAVEFKTTHCCNCGVLFAMTDTGGGCVGDNNAQDYFDDQKTILCAHVAAATGKPQDPENVWFSCAC